MLEVEQLAQKFLQVGPGFQKAGRKGEGEGRRREGKRGGGKRVQAGKAKVKKIGEEREEL